MRINKPEDIDVLPWTGDQVKDDHLYRLIDLYIANSDVLFDREKTKLTLELAQKHGWLNK